MNRHAVSIIVPTYNCIAKMDESLHSLDEVLHAANAEIIFVDDGSQDGTYDRLSSWAAERKNVRVVQLPTNSGSAGAPRNQGIELAQGHYVYFHDADDVLLPENLLGALAYAQKYAADAVRTSLLVQHADGRETLGDNVPRWDQIKDPHAQLRAIVKFQGLTCSFLMKRSILVDQGIRFDPQRRIGEDVVFTAQVLVACRKIAFRSKPVRKYVRSGTGQESVTQRLSANDFADFIRSWEDVEKTLEPRGVSFVREHGYAAMQYALRQFVWFRTEDLPEAVFRDFSDFCTKYWSAVGEFPFVPRYRELVQAARDGDHAAFSRAAQLRVLVAGHDLKFIEGLFPHLEDRYALRVDRWNGHTDHDAARSQELLRWADLVWVEWLLGAAVWYSERVRSDQRLVVRTHRSEMTATYGDSVRWGGVSAVIAIAPHTLSAFSDRFDIPRTKMWMIPNFFDVDAYDRNADDAKFGRIGMIGIVPELKGYDKAIEVLSQLRTTHPEMELWTYGRRPEELGWVASSEPAMKFYRECDERIEQLGLQDAVVHRGWVDMKQSAKEVGVFLSLSRYEGMQLAVGEAFCGGSLGLTLDWKGARDAYPHEFVFDSVDELVTAVVNYLEDRQRYDAASARGRKYIRTTYGIERVWGDIERMIRTVRA